MKNHSAARRVWVLLSCAGVGFCPLLSWALGLGDLQVESQLNQPLRARIEIMGIAGLENSPPIRARFAPAGANSGLLQSLRLSVEEDASQRHFVVVSSTEPLTEPLFDLPVQVAAESVQVVRNYSVLLDPPLLEDAGRRVASALPAPMRGAASVMRAKRPTQYPTQERLTGELVTLQRRLGKMQATISAQDAQIAHLTRRIGAAAETEEPRAVAQTRASSTPLPSRPVPPTRLELPHPVAVQEVGSEGESRPFWARPMMYYGIAAAGVLGAILAVVLTRLRRARAEDAPVERRPLTTVRFAGAESQSGAPPASVGAGVTYGSSRRTAGTHGYEVLDRLATTQETAIVKEWTMTFGAALGEGSQTAEPASTAAPAATAEAVVTAKAAAMSVRTALQHSGDSPTSATATAAATATTAVIPTEELQALELATPLGLDSTVRIEPSAEATVEMIQKLEMQPDGSVTNKEIIKLLERSLHTEPHRIDIQLKLLEMYHQEALGSRDSFHSLLGKVAAEQRRLSPAQQLHLDMLQRSLEDAKTDSGFGMAAEAAL